MSAKIGITHCTILLLATFALAVAMPPNASAQTVGCSASGSIPPLASTGTTCTTAMVVGQEKDIFIRVQNTSTANPPAPPDPVAAKLVGQITYTMACTDTTCSTQLPGTMEFVSVGTNGCVDSTAGVASCVASGDNQVLITMTGEGVALNLTGATPIATVRVRAVVPVMTGATCGQFGERFETGPNDIVTTDSTCDAVATGVAGGSLNEFFPALPPSVDIEKTCDDEEQICTDSAITFTVTVTNNGPYTLTSCTVDDPDCIGTVPEITDLAPTDSVSYTCTKPATPGGGAVDNTASVSCTDVYDQPASDSDTSNACSIPPCPPSVDIEKTCDDEEQICTDSAITFTVTVTNNGPNTLASCTVDDPDCTGDVPEITDLAPTDSVSYTCTKPATPGGDAVDNTASVSCMDVYDQPASDTDTSNACSIPPCPASVDIEKTCDDEEQVCTDSAITFTVTVTNNGPNTLASCTVDDPDCTGDVPEITDLAPTDSVSYTCTKPATPGGDAVDNTASVSCMDVYDQPASDTDTSNACSIPACPCSVEIVKTVARDVDCDGNPEGDFVDSITVDASVCVVYQICVTNTSPVTGGQTLDATGVQVSDDHLGIVNENFGTLLPGDQECKLVASQIEVPVEYCPDDLCVCADVEGVNTAYISSAICTTTNDSACDLALHPDSDCDDTAEVACTTPMGCRMTGGHNYFLEDSGYEGENGTFYTTGGQIGAPTDLGCRMEPGKGKQDGPWGDWEHNHHAGPDDTGSMFDGSFAFHSGTAAGPDDAYIRSIVCEDEGWCVQARPAPNKQIFWEGTGVFHNTKTKGNDDPMPFFAACGADQPVPFSKGKGKDGDTYSLHYYRAHVGDFGEPAGTKQNPADECSWVNGDAYVDNCDLVGNVELLGGPEGAPVNEKFSSLHPLCLAQDCEAASESNCPDFYEIEIHCTADPASPIAYKVAHFIREGNFQLHPSVGDSCNACGDGQCASIPDRSYYEDCGSCPEDCGECPF